MITKYEAIGISCLSRLKNLYAQVFHSCELSKANLTTPSKTLSEEVIQQVTNAIMTSNNQTPLDLLVTSPANDGCVHECLKMRTHSNGVPTPGVDTFLVLSKFANSPYSTSRNYQHIYVNRSETV